jgi:hypothetical protein
MNTGTPIYRLVAAAILLGIYLIIACILLWLLYNPGEKTSAPDWNHVLVIFNAIGAIATSAAGVLLGVEIQRENVVRADEAKKMAEADSNRKADAVRTALARIDALNGGAAAVNVNLDPVRLVLRNALGGPTDHL